MQTTFAARESFRFVAGLFPGMGKIKEDENERDAARTAQAMPFSAFLHALCDKKSEGDGTRTRNHRIDSPVL